MRTITRWALAAVIAIGLSDPTLAQVIRGTNGDAAVLPSTVDVAMTPAGPAVYAAVIIDTTDGLLGVIGCAAGSGVLYEADAGGAVRRMVKTWSSTGDHVSDGVAVLICRAAAARGLIPAPTPQAPRARPVNPQTI